MCCCNNCEALFEIPITYKLFYQSQGHREGGFHGFQETPFQFSTHDKFPPVMMHAHGYNLLSLVITI